MVLVSRTDLIEILGSAAGEADIRMGTTIAKLDDSDERVVSVELSDGTAQDFDLLIACDGIHSPTRRATQQAATEASLPMCHACSSEPVGQVT